MNNWRKCREAGQDEERQSEQAVLTALINRMNHNVYGQSAEGPYLKRTKSQSFVVQSQGICGKQSFVTRHCPICVLQSRLAVEAHVDPGDEITKNQDDDASIVYTAPKI